MLEAVSKRILLGPPVCILCSKIESLGKTGPEKSRL